MEYWEGSMDWPLDEDWVCETCSQNVGLEWGMVHAQCRCNNCHTQYFMRAEDEGRTILTTPKCMLKEKYKEPLKQACMKYHIPIDKLTDKMIDEFMLVPSPHPSLKGGDNGRTNSG